MKALNKFFVFFSILIILVSCFSPWTLAADETGTIGRGCDTTQTAALTNNTNVATRVYHYYAANQTGTTEWHNGPKKNPVDADSFKCSMYDVKRDSSIKNPADYKEVMVNYYYTDAKGNVLLGHTTIFTDFKFAIEDVGIDVEDGRLVISGTMYHDEDAWNQIFSNISGVITGISGLGVLCCMLAFIIQIIKLGASAGNPAEREKAIKGLLWTGVGTAGCSAAALIFGLAYGLI